MGSRDLSKLLYSKNHEWVDVTGNDGGIVVGITDYAQDALGEVVYVDFPEVDDNFAQNDEFCTLESTKAASPVYMPVAGSVTKLNSALEEDPSLVNNSPYDSGWLVEVKLDQEFDRSELITLEEYNKFLEKESD